MRVLPRAAAYTPCATLLLHTFLKLEADCFSSKSFWDTRAYRQLSNMSTCVKNGLLPAVRSTYIMKPTINSIFRDHAQEFLNTYKTDEHTRTVIWAISNCRTEALGGHVRECDNCGTKVIQYNSCRNRHCPD